MNRLSIKRLSIALLAVVLTLMAVLPMTGAAVAEDAPAVTVSSAEGYPGSEVTVNLSLSGNPGIAAFRFRLDYDSELLEIVDVNFPEMLGSPATGGPQSADPYTVTWFSTRSEDEHADGVFAELTFRIREEAPRGDSALTVSYDPLDICDNDFREINITTVGGSIAILCDHQWDAFNILCGKCGQKQLKGQMQQRINGDFKDFRILVETYGQNFTEADRVTLTIDFQDADHQPLRDKPMERNITTVYKSGVYAGTTFYPPSVEGYYIGGLIITDIPMSVPVKYVTVSVTFVKGDTEITYVMGTATLP